MIGGPELSLAECVSLACFLEARAPKPGNVHLYASFSDLTFEHLVEAGKCAAPILAQSRAMGVGSAILAAVDATGRVVASNANLGIILLFAPLCAAEEDGNDWQMSIRAVLDRLSVDDARLAYQAIRRSVPGGLGQVEKEDISAEPTVTLLEAMRLAQDRDTIALQYASGFRGILEWGAPALVEAVKAGLTMDQAVVWSHLQWMAKYPDSLIARKCGKDVARESGARAQELIERQRTEMTGLPKSGFMKDPQMRAFDSWLRADGNKRNPGTSADLVAASLFVALRTSREFTAVAKRDRDVAAHGEDFQFHD